MLSAGRYRRLRARGHWVEHVECGMIVDSSSLDLVAACYPCFKKICQHLMVHNLSGAFFVAVDV